MERSHQLNAPTLFCRRIPIGRMLEMTSIQQQHITGRARRKHSKQRKRKRLRQQHEHQKRPPHAPLSALSDDQVDRISGMVPAQSDQ